MCFYAHFSLLCQRKHLPLFFFTVIVLLCFSMLLWLFFSHNFYQSASKWLYLIYNLWTAHLIISEYFFCGKLHNNNLDAPSLAMVDLFYRTKHARAVKHLCKLTSHLVGIFLFGSYFRFYTVFMSIVFTFI